MEIVTINFFVLKKWENKFKSPVKKEKKRGKRMDGRVQNTKNIFPEVQRFSCSFIIVIIQ